MKRIYSLLLVGILAFIPIWAQQSDYYYYYKGNSIDLPVDSTRLYIVSKGELKPQSSKDFYATDYSINCSYKKHVYNNLQPLQKQRSSTSTSEVYFSTLNIPKELAKSKYKELIEEMKANDNVWQVTPSFKRKGKSFDVTNSFYVKLKEAKDSFLLKKIAETYSLEIIGYNKYMPLWYTLSCVGGSKLNSIEAANLFFETGLFAATEPEFVNVFHTLSNDPYYNEQWGLKNIGQDDGISGMDINIEGAWNITKGNDSIVVTVFDTGVDYAHPDLNVSAYYDTVHGENYSTWYDSHGTTCAGIIAALHNDIGIKGVAPNVKLLSVSNSLGLDQDYTQGFADGFNWAWKEKKSDVINCSWYLLTPVEIIENAIDSALINGRGKKGCVIAFAAGNDDYHMVNYPGDVHPDILVVGGILNTGKRCNENDAEWGSNYGVGLDVMAPGNYIMSTYLGGTFKKADNHGSSFACPHVSGVAALMLSVNPELTNTEVNTIIESTSRKVRPDLYTYSITANRPNGPWNNEMGYGLIDATAAVEAANTSKHNEVHLSNIVINNDDTLYYRNVIMDNIQITDSASVLIKKFQKATLDTNIQIEKGVRLKITNL